MHVQRGLGNAVPPQPCKSANHPDILRQNLRGLGRLLCARLGLGQRVRGQPTTAALAETLERSGNLCLQYPPNLLAPAP